MRQIYRTCLQSSCKYIPKSVQYTASSNGLVPYSSGSLLDSGGELKPTDLWSSNLFPDPWNIVSMLLRTYLGIYESQVLSHERAEPKTKNADTYSHYSVYLPMLYSS